MSQQQDLIEFTSNGEKDIDRNRIMSADESESVSSSNFINNAVEPVLLADQQHPTMPLPSTMYSTLTADVVSKLPAPMNVKLERNSMENPPPIIQNDQSNIEPIGNILSMIPEKSVTHIKDSVVGIPLEMKKVPSPETEEDDHLTPLMMDNHTVLEHQETFKSSLSRAIDINRINEIPEFIPSYPPLKHCDTKDLFHSIDSEGLVSYDRRNSQESSNPSGYSSDGLSSDENAKDSGCDVKSPKSENESESIEPIEIPDDETAEKIVTQVEFYFSNENILKDAFLLKHVRRNKEGFVSLKLISSFKRVRQITKDWRVVGYAIKLKSKNIEVNDLGTKVRRLESLPQFDETMPSRTVVATDLPLEKVTIEKVSDLFSKCGEIALIRILRPGAAIPADVRQFINKYPDLQQRYCALVEFTESQSARNALNLNTGMQIFEMVAPKKKTGKKATIAKIIENYKYNDVERSRGGDDYKYNGFRRNSGFIMKQQQQQQQQHDIQSHHICQPRHFSMVNNENCDNFNRRSSTCSNGSNTDMPRRYSNCSDGYSSCSNLDNSRRASLCSDISRRQSNCSDVSFRRTSNCSDYCPCSGRRPSQCADPFRRISQCSEHNRRYSNGSINFERRISNGIDNNGIGGIGGGPRRVSFDGDFDRKISNGSINGTGCDYRKSVVDRKFSNDSGYDRKMSNSSVISDCTPLTPVRYISSNAVSMNKIESLVRTPMGPDGSKGFLSRARKVGQVVGPL